MALPDTLLFLVSVIDLTFAVLCSQHSVEGGKEGRSDKGTGGCQKYTHSEQGAGGKGIDPILVPQ